MPRALVLYSGSLASTVAAKLLATGHNWEVDLLYVRTPFLNAAELVKARARRLFPGFGFSSCGLKREYSLCWHRVVEQGFPFPCGACRSLLLFKAARIMRRKRYDLLVTGEIVGRGGLGVRDLLQLESLVGLRGKVFRPLSAALLPPVKPVDDGLRSVPQLGLCGDAEGELRDLARELGIPPPDWNKFDSCPLEDEGFAARVFTLLRRGPVNLNTIWLMQFPHIFAAEEFVMVVALSPEERRELQSFFLPDDVRLYIQVPGSPLGLVRFREELSPGEAQGLLELCARVIAALGGYAPGEEVKVAYRHELSEELDYVYVRPLEREYLERLRLPGLNSEVKLIYLD